MSVAASDRIRTREPFDFRGTRTRIHLSSADTGGAYAHYFTTIADCLRRGPVTLDEEFAVAARFGQEFLGRAGHWAQG
jgi:hypothetical protein